MTLNRPFAAVFTVQSILEPKSTYWKFTPPCDGIGTCAPVRTETLSPLDVASIVKGRLLVFRSPVGCCSYRDRTTWTLTTGPFSGSDVCCASAELARSGKSKATQNTIR